MSKCLKIQEFQAHAHNVNCISIGRNSTGVLVTGGDDGLVKLWTIGTNQSTMALTASSSAVESVTFDGKEEVVAAGTSGGSIKIFDMSTLKHTRTLSGHKNNVKSLDWHRDYLISGGQDGTVKLWDLRQPNPAKNFAPFSSHNTIVTKVKLSPDGRFMAIGCDDGAVKVLEHSTGRCHFDFKKHTHAITSMVFNPAYWVLATGSMDRTVKVWDLESQASSYGHLHESSPFESAPVKAIEFHHSGDQLFTATQDSLKVWNWDEKPMTVLDTVDVAWSKIAEMAVMKDSSRLVACTFHKTIVGVWVAELNRMRPWLQEDDSGMDARALPPAGAGNAKAAVRSPHARQRDSGPSPAAASAHQLASPPMSYQQPTAPALPAIQGPGQMTPTQGGLTPKGREFPGPRTSDGGSTGGLDLSSSQLHYQAQLQLEQERARKAMLQQQSSAAGSRDPSRDRYNPTRYSDAQVPVSPSNASQATPTQQQQSQQQYLPAGQIAARQDAAQGRDKASPRHRSQSPSPLHAGLGLPPPSQQQTPVPLSSNPVRGPSPNRYAAEGSQCAGIQTPPVNVRGPSPSRSGDVNRVPQPQIPVSIYAPVLDRPKSGMVSVGVGVGDSLMRGSGEVASSRQSGAGTPPAVPQGLPRPKDHFKPPVLARISDNGSPRERKPPTAQIAQMTIVDNPTIDNLVAECVGNNAVGAKLTERLSAMRAIKTSLQRGELKHALYTARSMSQDPVPAGDMLAALVTRKGFEGHLALELVPDLTPILGNILKQGNERHRMVAADVGFMVLRSFGPLIRDVCCSDASAAGKRQVDLAAEQRRNKCEAAKMALTGLRPGLNMALHMAENQDASVQLVMKLKDLSQQLSTIE